MIFRPGSDENWLQNAQFCTAVLKRLQQFKSEQVSFCRIGQMEGQFCTGKSHFANYVSSWKILNTVEFTASIILVPSTIAQIWKHYEFCKL